MLKKTLIVSTLALSIIACGSGGSDDKTVPTADSLAEDLNQEMNSSGLDDVNQTLSDSSRSDEVNATDINNTINDINTSELNTTSINDAIGEIDTSGSSNSNNTNPNVDIPDTTTPDLNTITTLKKGYLVDAPIEGVAYACGEIEGYTTGTGEFSCSDTPVNFTIGSYNLGTLDNLTTDGMVYPQDLIEGIGRDNFDDERLTEMVQLLQSLDDDGDISEIIKIDPKAVEKFNEFGEATNGLDLLALVDLAGKGVVDADTAIEHLKDNIPNEELQNVVDSVSDTDSLGEEGGIDSIVENIIGEEGKDVVNGASDTDSLMEEGNVDSMLDNILGG